MLGPVRTVNISRDVVVPCSGERAGEPDGSAGNEDANRRVRDQVLSGRAEHQIVQR